MTPHPSHRRLSILALLMGSALGCGADSGAVAPAEPDIDTPFDDFNDAVAVEIHEPDAGPDASVTPPECWSHDDCSVSYCDHADGVCVECLISAHCPGDEPVCRQGVCEDEVPCGPDAPCGSGVCPPGGSACVDCLTASDCDAGDVCHDGVCASPPVPCPTGDECGPFALHCDVSADVCVECIEHKHCKATEFCGADGACRPDICPADSIRTDCSTLGLWVCAQSGGAWIEVPCEGGLACKEGSAGVQPATCSPVICAPDAQNCINDEDYSLCNSTGTALASFSCPPGSSCQDGACRFPRPVILVVFDTSSSMWAYPGGGVPEQCEQLGEPCVSPWPGCEAESGPVTLIGRSKTVFAELFEQFSDKVHFGLLRFPQRAAGTKLPGCKTGYYEGKDKLTGDDDVYPAPDGAQGWFRAHLGEALLVPTPKLEAGNNLEAMRVWLDGTEALAPLDLPCASDAGCGLGEVCVADAGGALRCHAHSDPELRAIGQTPLGRSLYYAGEYLRQDVVVEGKECVTEADCGTPFHACTGGLCRDPNRTCRQYVILVFTDGTESVDPSLGSWFHPRNQAKRMRYGLGCSSDAGCLSKAVCTGGACQSAAQDVSGKSCFGSGAYCQTDEGCGAAAPCVSNANLFVDSVGQQTLTDREGAPIVVTTSVVTIGKGASDAKYIAENGGGDFVEVQDADPDALYSALANLVSAKIASACVETPP
jgi:hypothetical protein